MQALRNMGLSQSLGRGLESLETVDARIGRDGVFARLRAWEGLLVRRCAKIEHLLATKGESYGSDVDPSGDMHPCSIVMLASGWALRKWKLAREMGLSYTWWPWRLCSCRPCIDDRSATGGTHLLSFEPTLQATKVQNVSTR